jgi:phage FluMu protein Com
MVDIKELRVCKSCGNVFSKKAGVTNILECPQCKQTNFDTVEIKDDELFP